MVESKLLDLNDCDDELFKRVHKEMLAIALLRYPKWFRYLLKKSPFARKYVGYDFWSRAWEYPWAIYAANFEKRSRVIDVGGGGSPFADYLASLGHDCYVIDPSLRGGVNLKIDKNKSVFRNLRSLIYRSVANFLKIDIVEGLPSIRRNPSVKYLFQNAQCINFPDNYFDRVFCLSVMEHIPRDDWKKCMEEFARVLKRGGRLVITLDMTIDEANKRLYMRLIDYSSLTLIGTPYYEVPISQEDRAKRHGHFYETVGLVWQA